MRAARGSDTIVPRCLQNMPPLAIHTVIAKQMAERLRLPALDEERGNVYLGSTAPDIRVITRWDRQRTHFFDIHNFGEQSSARAFIESNPAITDAGKLTQRTQAFLAGYLSHLVVDEGWIGAVYRPFFGERSARFGLSRRSRRVIRRSRICSHECVVRWPTGFRSIGW